MNVHTGDTRENFSGIDYRIKGVNSAGSGKGVDRSGD